MSAAAAGTSAMFDERIDPGRVASFLLAAAMHLALFAVLVFGVRWQNRPPEAVVVELWNEPVPAQIQAEPKPEPAPAALKPEPVIPKPDIAEKAPPPKPAPKVEQKPKPEPPRVAIRPRDGEAQRQIREQLNREQASLAIDRERQQIRDQLAYDAAAARNKAIADWVNKVRAKIRGNVVLPPDIKGNPEAIFDVVQLPTGEVLSAKVRKTSGHQALDDAIERAILKSSPLPRPDRSETAPRAFELKYRPLD
jgi:colicin import membrane protein